MSRFRHAAIELYCVGNHGFYVEPRNQQSELSKYPGDDYAPVCSQRCCLVTHRLGTLKHATLVLFRVMLFCWGLFLSLAHSVAYSSILHSDTNPGEHFPSCQKGSVYKQCPKAAQLDISAGPRKLCQWTHLILICPQAHRLQGVVCFYFL